MSIKIPFATLSFEDTEDEEKCEDVFIVQVFRGMGHGAIIECAACEMNVDEIIDAPTVHQEKCRKG